MAEQQWIDWKPKAGDIRPAGYRYWSRMAGCWVIGGEQGLSVNSWDAANTQYQVPAPAVTTAEDRPPWIDPQCKFRWGDRVKDVHGRVLFVINPQDTANQGFVVVATRLSAAVPYAMYSLSNLSISLRCEDELRPFPEDLPKHFDDRILDADQPQESFASLVSKAYYKAESEACIEAYGPIETARVPREIWVSSYGNRLGPWHYPSLESALAEGSASVPVHFREVL